MMQETVQPDSDGPSGQERPPPATGRWIRKELILAGASIAVGAILLPIAIYFTGQALLGPYSDEGHGIGHLYGDIFADLAAGYLPAWILVLSPWLGIQALRLAIVPLRRKRAPSPPPDNL